MQWLAERLTHRAGKISGRFRSGNRPPPVLCPSTVETSAFAPGRERRPAGKNCVGDRDARSRQCRDLALPRKLPPNGQKQRLSTYCRKGRFRPRTGRSSDHFSLAALGRSRRPVEKQSPMQSATAILGVARGDLRRHCRTTTAELESRWFAGVCNDTLSNYQGRIACVS